MKCPKCGFNSFEYYDTCKKCSSDLIAYKQTYSIASLVLPFEAIEKLSADFRSADTSSGQEEDVSEVHDDIFSFDLPEDSSQVAAEAADDPFSFTETSSDTEQSGSTNFAEDVFANLLESSPQVEDSPFTAPKEMPVANPGVLPTTDSAPGTGEFDLESFSWDDTPAVSAGSKSDEAVDDFDSLFGDTADNNTK
jgi:hypothetical protein